jgi:TolB-like protein
MIELSPARIFQEARRRRVFQIAAIYIVGAFVALQVADLAFPGLSIPETAIKYVWIGAIIGFPFALFFGWRFDLVDGRILRTAAVDGAPGSPIGKGDKLTLSMMSMLLAVMCVGLVFEITQIRVDDRVGPRLADAAPNSVAVLPFANFGGVAANAYLADGLAETILHALAQASGLRVTARTSSFYYKGKDEDVRDIAAELGVSKILEGSVQQSGGRLRVVAQLIEADTGFHLWSNTYDSDLDDVFAIQDSISSNVAIAILATVTAAPGLSDARLTGVSTTNFEAYEKYLQGLEQARISSNISLPKAEVLFRQALASDPDFFEANAELANTIIDMESNGTIVDEVALERLGPVRERLLEERPDDGMSIVTDVRFRLLRDSESVNFEDLVPKLVAAIEREPNETRVYNLLADVLRLTGRREEALEWINRAIIVDPLDYALYFDLAYLRNSLGDTQGYIGALERVTEINPQWPSGHARLGWAKFHGANDYVGWYQAMRRAAALDPLDHEMEVGLAQGLCILGLYEESSRHAARAAVINAANGGEWRVSSVLSLLGSPAESRILTESFLRRESSTRNLTHAFPVSVYTSASIKDGKADEALAVFEEIMPGVTAEDFTPTSDKEFYFQYGATVAWAHGKGANEITARLDALAPHPFWEVAGFPVARAIVYGDIDAATRLAVEDIKLGYWYNTVLYKHLYPLDILAQAPAVAASLAAIEEAHLPGRDALQAYIAAQKRQAINSPKALRVTRNRP